MNGHAGTQMLETAWRPTEATRTTPSVESVILESVSRFRDELPGLAWLPQHRYDASMFPTLGQYDWLAGQVLYALVRHLRPRVMVEFSTSSGYSTAFTALALRANGMGELHSVDIDATALAAARRLLESRGVAEIVHLHHGDCRTVVPPLVEKGDVDVLFIDSLHSFGLAEWYLAQLVPRLRPEVFVQIHDVMPPEARVRIHGGPPYGPEPRPPRPPMSHLLKRTVWLALHGRFASPMPARRPREALPLNRLATHAPTNAGELESIDGNYFEEAVLLRELLQGTDPAQAVYLHRLQHQLPELEPQRFAHVDVMRRTDACGRPVEWNDALWCRAELLQRLAPPHLVRRWRRRLQRRFYDWPARWTRGMFP